MTSFLIEDHVNREVGPSWTDSPDCIFCRIIRQDAEAHRLYETDKVIAFLDILPLRPGHTLIVPKTHCARISELPSDFAGALGEAVAHVSRALTEALHNTALNIVCNQEYAQAVPHVHYHVIPAPNFGPTATSGIKSKNIVSKRHPPTHKEMHRMEFEAREELDDDDARELVQKITARL